MVDAFEIATRRKGLTMPKMNLSHFEAAILFALLTSIVLGVVTKRTDRERSAMAYSASLYFVRRDVRP